MSVSGTRSAGRYASCYAQEEEQFADKHSDEICKVARAWFAEFAHNPNRPDRTTLGGILEKRVDVAFPEIPLRGFVFLKSNIVGSVLDTIRWK